MKLLNFSSSNLIDFKAFGGESWNSMPLLLFSKEIFVFLEMRGNILFVIEAYLPPQILVNDLYY